MPESQLDPHLLEIMVSLKAGESQRALAKRYGVARSTLQHWLSQNDLAAAPVPDNGSRIKDVDVLEAELKELRAAAKKEYTLDLQAERVLRDVRSAVQAAPIKWDPPLDILVETNNHVMVLLLSDTHAGEVVVPEAVNGLNEYNWAILEERMRGIMRSLLSFVAHRPYPIAELHIYCLGDMNSGSNHLELAETNEYPAADQAYRFGLLLGQWIEELLPNFGRVVVKGVSGNHPRTHVKPMSKQVFDNFDWLSYKIAETYLHNYIEAGHVECEFPRSGFIVAEVAGTKGLLFHGDGIRSTMPGVPWGGVMRRVNEFKKQYAEAGVYLNWFALGHFHQANCVQSSVFMNGSVKGLDEYSLKNFGAGEKPTQLLLTFQSDKARLTDVSYINP